MVLNVLSTVGPTINNSLKFEIAKIIHLKFQNVLSLSYRVDSYCTTTMNEFEADVGTSRWQK